MKKITSIITAASLIFCLSSCGKQTDTPSEPEHIGLTCHMSEKERNSAVLRDFSLLDDTDSGHTVSIEYRTPDEMAEGETDEEYLEMLDNCRKRNALIPFCTLIDGTYYTGLTPDSDYTGGEISFYITSGSGETEKLDFADMDEYMNWLKDELDAEYSDMPELGDEMYKATELVFRAVIDGTYEALPAGSVDMDDLNFDSPFTDYSGKWEFDRGEIGQIKDSIREIAMYDEEMDTNFLVHVTLPPDYDANREYPVFLLTDGVWRLGDVPALRKMTENGEAGDALLVTLGFDPKLDNTADIVRVEFFLEKKQELLDFITDDLMPFLGENFNIDCANSTLYGHSDGGAFSHFAAFSSDLYENQPFGNYIIGSPAFWCLYRCESISAPEEYLSDYGYFSRNTALGKRLFICGGAQEDPDYAGYYNGHETTLEGIKHLAERLDAAGVKSCEYKLYDSHHYQYIPEMLKEVFEKFCPAG